MERNFVDFDPGDKPFDVKIDYQPPASPLTMPEEDPIRLEIYELFVRGYSPPAIVRKMEGKINIKIAQVKEILDQEREVRSEYRKQASPNAIQDAIEYYQRMKITAEDRALYADEKSAPEFLKIAMEAQNRIDKLLGLEGEKAGRMPEDGEIEGLGMYRLRANARILRDGEALPSGDTASAD